MVELSVHTTPPLDTTPVGQAPDSIPEREDQRNEFKETFGVPTKSDGRPAGRSFKCVECNTSAAGKSIECGTCGNIVGYEIDTSKKKAIKMEVAITVAAFANTEGGRLFIGVNDDGEPVGLGRDLDQHKTHDGLERAIRDFLFETLKPPTALKLDFKFNDDHLVIFVHKHGGLSNIIVDDGKSYIPKQNDVVWFFINGAFLCEIRKPEPEIDHAWTRFYTSCSTAR